MDQDVRWAVALGAMAGPVGLMTGVAYQHDDEKLFGTGVLILLLIIGGAWALAYGNFNDDGDGLW